MTHTSPLVSVLIPTYNRAEYLRSAIESACNQTYPNLEIRVHDDASPDHTPEMMESFAADKRVIYSRNEANLGLVANWKKAIASSRGQFFCVVGDDDLLEETYVEKLVKPLIEHDDVTLAFSDHWIIDAGGEVLTKESDTNSVRWKRTEYQSGVIEDVSKLSLIDRSVFIGTSLFRRADLDVNGIRDESTVFLDYWLFYLASKTGKKAYYVDERLAYCRWQNTGVSRNWNWRVYGFPGEIFCYRIMIEDPELKQYRRLFKRRLARSLKTYGNTLLTLEKIEEARDALGESLMLRRKPSTYYSYALTRLGRPGSAVIRFFRKLRDRLALPGTDR